MFRLYGTSQETVSAAEDDCPVPYPLLQLSLRSSAHWRGRPPTLKQTLPLLLHHVRTPRAGAGQVSVTVLRKFPLVLSLLSHRERRLALPTVFRAPSEGLA